MFVILCILLLAAGAALLAVLLRGKDRLGKPAQALLGLAGLGLLCLGGALLAAVLSGRLVLPLA